VIGVLPASFRFGRKPDVVMPLRLDAQSAPEHLNFLRVIGKLRPGIRLTQGRSAMQTLFPIYQKADEGLTGVVLTPYRDILVAGSRPLLLVLLGAVFAVLLIACTNIANLLLARAAAREKEIAIRISLGAAACAWRDSCLPRACCWEYLVACWVSCWHGSVWTRYARC